MKSILLLSLLLSSFAFAEDDIIQTTGLIFMDGYVFEDLPQPTPLDLTPDQRLEVILTEARCSTSDSATRLASTEYLSEREEIPGQNYYGVTSQGDVAVLKNNNQLNFYICDRGMDGIASPSSSNIVVNPSATCAVDEISALNIYLPKKNTFIPLFFRPLNGSTLCLDQRTKDITADQTTGKSVELKMSTSLRPNGLKMSTSLGSSAAQE